ncbi:MAG: RluA family pseudouridine synthase [Alphaproteobacteria bacterium]|nr:RluA family pseudouridine synthase [Alphaproteobacteria bacterium]
MNGVSSKSVTGDEEGMRLDRWFKAHFPTLGFGRLQKLLRSGQVRVDGKRAKTNLRLEAGQTIRIPPISDEPPEVRNEASERDRDAIAKMTLHDDGTVLVLNKPAGLAVQGGPGLTRHVDGMLGALIGSDGQRPRLVHRLDRDTSGVLLIAKTRLAAKSLAESFKARDTRKIYWGLVASVPKPRQGRISTWLKKQEGPEGEVMHSYLQRQGGAVHAVSQYAVVEQSAHKLSWLVLQPVTGRTHQLRVHAAEIGHPIVGDAKYFNIENWELPGGIQNRLHLHARSISIPHPEGGILEVSAPLPGHMQQSWNLLGLDVELGDQILEELP